MASGATTLRRHPRRPRVFSDYLLSLDTAGTPPSRESFDRVWTALRTALRTELRSRGLWTSPPRFLGVIGADRWDEEALEELTEDAYVFNFVDRLRSLRAQLEVKPNVDGLVLLNLKNFLYERQRRHDPLGARLFGTLRAALRELVAAGTLAVVHGPPEIRNETVLRLSGTASESKRRKTQPRSSPSLEELTADWADDLLPGLITARGGRYDEVIADLEGKICSLRHLGPEELSVRELLDPLRTAVRARWRALRVSRGADVGVARASEADDLFGDVRRRYRPDTEVADAEAFEKLTECVERHVRSLDSDERTIEYLSNLWRFLRIHAAGERDLPSRRKLGEQLGIPRNRFPELYDALGAFLKSCRKLLLEPRPRGKGGAG